VRRPTRETDVIVVGAGQSGLAASRALRSHGLSPVVLEAAHEPGGSWPRYYDSLRAFSPARHSALSGQTFPGDPDHYPHRDEVTDYLRRHAAGLDIEIRYHAKVTAIHPHPRDGFIVHVADGEPVAAAGIVAASGAFDNPHTPALPGQRNFAGRQLHAADYRNPASFGGERIVIVGGGNTAMQIAYELAGVGAVTLATHRPIEFFPQCLNGRDVHHWLTTSGFDQLPPDWLARILPNRFVMDTGDYANALNSGRLDRRAMFTRFDSDRVIWADGSAEPVDSIIYATGYRPNLGYLEPLGALEADAPKHAGGISTTHLGLVYVGLEFQRSFASNTLRGVYADAKYVAAPLAAYLADAPAAVGL
jgi:putative flavoprotein involved in K+ transport